LDDISCVDTPTPNSGTQRGDDADSAAADVTGLGAGTIVTGDADGLVGDGDVMGADRRGRDGGAAVIAR
jgi:hypothetical protein